jgi:hypothetical protein
VANFAPSTASIFSQASRGSTALDASKFPQQSPEGAPPADLFNIWRDDYMLTPADAAAEAAERSKDTLFDGVLPPFSNIGNTTRGDVDGLFRVDDSVYVLESGLKGQRGLGYARDFSTANPTSAYDTDKFGKVSLKNAALVENPLNKGIAVEDIAAKVEAKSKSQKTYALRTFSNFAKWRSGDANFQEKDGDAGLRGSG